MSEKVKDYLKKVDDYAFMIQDPFDVTYNPSRSVENGSGTLKDYQNHFKKALRVMLSTG